MTDACSWEKLSVKEITQVFCVVRESLPDIDKKLQALGGAAASALVQGLRAYGWTGPELSKGGSELMNLIGKEINVQQLHRDHIVPTTKGPSSTSDQPHVEAAEQPDTVAPRRFARSHLSIR
jgi:hypothetical protein